MTHDSWLIKSWLIIFHGRGKRFEIKKRRWINAEQGRTKSLGRRGTDHDSWLIESWFIKSWLIILDKRGMRSGIKGGWGGQGQVPWEGKPANFHQFGFGSKCCTAVSRCETTLVLHDRENHLILFALNHFFGPAVLVWTVTGMHVCGGGRECHYCGSTLWLHNRRPLEYCPRQHGSHSFLCIQSWWCQIANLLDMIYIIIDSIYITYII